MTRKEALQELDHAPCQAFNNDTAVELTKNMEINISSIYDYFENRTCNNCNKDDEPFGCDIKSAVGGNWAIRHNFGCNKWEQK